MTESISYIKCRIDPATSDSITVGLLYIDKDENVQIFVSEKRMNIAKNLIGAGAYILFSSYVKGLQEWVKNGLATHNKILHEAIHQNGVVEVEKPHHISKSPDPKNPYAKGIFEKNINRNYNEKK